MFTPEELKNLQVLISRTQITGQEALAVALLQQKITGLLQLPVEKQAEKPVEKSK